MIRLRDVAYCAHGNGAIIFGRSIEGRIGVVFSNTGRFDHISNRPGTAAEIAKIYGWTPVKKCKYLRTMKKINGIIPKIEEIKP